ncbi:MULTISPECIES: excalibur calcium-binding domain-containing protein [Luteimonas]|uniref:excalibur calcium-binding domain-containing protein n=1 Tax=Luteimonas TaxID=83614 RepID=UPI000C7B6861|nr:MULTISPECIES: excalibur calcium-binding domain-containing protein [Luteimonas]
MPAPPRHLIALVLALGVGAAHAHGGGLDRHGCHNDRKNGDYHCHRPAASAPPSVQPLPSRSAPASPRFGLQPQRSQGAFRNCTEAREAGAAPVHRGEPGYGPHLDRDDDGVGCEPQRGR